MKTIRFASLLLAALSFFCTFPACAQTEPNISLLNITGTATGFGLNGGMVKANIATAGLQLTHTLSVAYEQINVSTLSDHFRLGMLNYSQTADKFLPLSLKKRLIFNASDYVVTFSAGAGKFGPHIVESGALSLTRPLATHLGWQILSYQYIHAPISGIINKSYQSMSTGPIFFF